MLSADSSTLMQIAMAILTLIGGLVSGWLAKAHLAPATESPPSPPINPVVTNAGGLLPAAPGGDLLRILQGIISPGSIQPAPVPVQQPAASDSRHQIFHLFAQIILQLPLDATAKGRAIQGLVGFLDSMLAKSSQGSSPSNSS